MGHFSGETFDYLAALRNLDGELDILAEVAWEFLQDCPWRMARIRHLLRRGDVHGAGLVAHNLRGMLATISAAAARDVARALELDCELGDTDAAVKHYGALRVRMRDLADELAVWLAQVKPSLPRVSSTPAA